MYILVQKIKRTNRLEEGFYKKNKLLAAIVAAVCVTGKK